MIIKSHIRIGFIAVAFVTSGPMFASPATALPSVPSHEPGRNCVLSDPAQDCLVGGGTDTTAPVGSASALGTAGDAFLFGDGANASADCIPGSDACNGGNGGLLWGNGGNGANGGNGGRATALFGNGGDGGAGNLAYNNGDGGDGGAGGLLYGDGGDGGAGADCSIACISTPDRQSPGKGGSGGNAGLLIGNGGKGGNGGSDNLIGAPRGSTVSAVARIGGNGGSAGLLLGSGGNGGNGGNAVGHFGAIGGLGGIGGLGSLFGQPGAFGERGTATVVPRSAVAASERRAATSAESGAGTSSRLGR